MLNGYRIRESRRAKYVSIKVSTWGEVEVVAPPGTESQRIAVILEQRQDWIHATQQRIQDERQAIAHETAVALPTDVVLRAIDQTWSVSYEATPDLNVTLNVLSPNQASARDTRRLHMTGQIDQISLCHNVLGQWIRAYAQQQLGGWLRQVSREVGLPFNRMTIRRQKTRWASCSSKSSISLNDKLLFLPADLVRYVLIHELCHTIHLNHSSAFWSLVGQKEPNYKALDDELRTAWRYVPRWLEGD